MTGPDGYSAWNTPAGGGPTPYNQPPYPQQQQPAQYPPQQYPPQQGYQQPQYSQPQYQQPPGPPQQYPPPQQAYPGPQTQYPPQQQFQQPQQGYGQAIVIPIEGRGVAKLAAKMAPRQLVVSPQGIAHEGKNNAFRVAWSDLHWVAITTAYHRSGLLSPKIWRIRLVMGAADQGFPQRHPELAGFQGRFGGNGPGSYGVPLGPVRNIVEQLAQALGMYGGQAFAGVLEEGQVLGFGYA